MRAISLLLTALLCLAGCGEGTDASAPPGGTAGSAGEAGSAGAAGAAGVGGAGGETDAGQDVQGQDAATCSLPLTAEEKQLIESGDENTKMEIVTNKTTEGDEFLRRIACPIDPAEADTKLLIARMRTTLAAISGTVGIAGPQVGISRRLFLAQRDDVQKDLVVPYLNPAITSYSTETAKGGEGCLSIPGKSGQVMRSLIVVVDYVKEDGTAVTGESIGSLTDSVAKYSARIMQHEYDHLDGILFIDRL